MQAVRKFIAANSERLGPYIFLFVCLVAFGLFIPFLGFYWDDWPTIFYTFNNRVGQLINHFSYDRPFSVWAYWVVGRLGTSPVIWQIAALLLRWVGVVALAWALKPLWKEHYKKILYIGLLFAIYPGYYVQSSSVIFIPHLASLALFLVSLGAMGRAVAGRGRSRWFTVMALGTAAIQMFTVEYFVGLELIRPVYLWILLTNLSVRKKVTVKEVSKVWAPYLAVFAAWLIWRLFLLRLPTEPYPLVLLADLRSNPLATIGQLLLVILNDMQYTLIQTWTDLIQPVFASLSTGFGLINAAISLGVAGILFLVFSAFHSSKSKLGISDYRFARQGLTLGLASFLLGMFPVWAIGETIARGDYNLRYILVGMLGSSLMVASVLVLVVPSKRHRVVLFCLMAAFAIGSHINAANNYRLDWEEQRAFYWQLTWRAPALEDNTALVSFDRVSKHLGDPMTGNALNVLYPPDSVAPSVDLWNFELNRTQTVNAIQNDESMQNDYRGLTFSTGSSDDLVFYFLPEGGCLWILRPNDTANEYLPTENLDLVAHSNPGNILPVHEETSYPPTHIFGNEPRHNWCYFFEKADLARQLGEWDEVIRLMDEATQKELSPNIGIEWLPLVEAYAATGDWGAAEETSLQIHTMHAKNDGMICATWAALLAGSADQSVSREANARVGEFANCPSP
jgi:hypothetical protein